MAKRVTIGKVDFSDAKVMVFNEDGSAKILSPKEAEKLKKKEEAK